MNKFLLDYKIEFVTIIIVLLVGILSGVFVHHLKLEVEKFGVKQILEQVWYGKK